MMDIMLIFLTVPIVYLIGIVAFKMSVVEILEFESRINLVSRGDRMYALYSLNPNRFPAYGIFDKSMNSKLLEEVRKTTMLEL